MDSSTSNEPTLRTVSDDLERLAVTAGKISMITADQALSLLSGLDGAYERIQALPQGSQSRRLVETQMDEITAELRKEAPQFIRDLGGIQALRQAREKIQPAADHWWWYLDEVLMGKRRAALKRNLIVVGAVAVVLIILALVYQRFLAPDPKFIARYDAEQNASRLIINGDLKDAMEQVNKGLQIAPDDTNLLIAKGVIEEAQGQSAQAQQAFDAAQKLIPAQDEFYVTRGQTYAMANEPEKALADAQQAIKINPISAEGFLLMGQAHEMLKEYQKALNDYDQAYKAADKANQPALAAVARQRTGLLMQLINSGVTTPVVTPTAK